ncbi:MAG: sigma-70 family RNA polymerase sigma factor [Chitinophagales bacterium]|nr:sigma-70 family RNA polymerase sigma factor [Chitinophagales bacterium]
MESRIISTEEDFLRGVRQDDAVVLKRLYKMHYPMILNLVLNNSGDEDEAKDLYQEGFMAFYEQVRREGFQLNCKIKTYIYSICRRLWLKRLGEKSKFSKKIKDDDDFHDLLEDEPFLAENEIKIEVMNMSMAKLGEPCKSLIEDFYVHHMSMGEISDKFGYTNAENAKNQKYKCLQRLKKIFFVNYNGNEGYDEY